jgi:DNA-binding MarR family transcriptional regulator
MPKQLFGIKSDLSSTKYCVVLNCRKTTRAVTKLYDLALGPCGVRSTQLSILVGTAKSQPVSIGGLSDMLLIDTTTLTRSLHLLQRQGLVRISTRSTMRQRFVTLTHEGTRVIDRSIPLWRNVQTRLVTAIGDQRWKALQQELAQLSALALRLQQNGRTTP